LDPARFRRIAFVPTVCLALLFTPDTARADDDASMPTPRTAVTIGNASVVLVATTDRLYAFVDRIEDNAPVGDAEIDIDTPEGSSIAMDRAPITMNRATAGLFVAPFDRKGHLRDSFIVTLRSSAGSGQETVEIVYDPAAASAAIAPASGIGSKLAVALVSGGIGAVASVLAMLWWRGSRRHPSTTPVGSAQPV